MLHTTLAVLRKDLRSELRTRYSLSAVLLFVLTSIVMILFATGGEKLSNELLSGVVWVIMFFSAMTGMAKSFVSEEERGTALLLQLSTPSTAVYFGKLCYNILLSLVLNALALFLFAFFFASFVVQEYAAFFLILLLGSIGIAASTTIISAIIAKANTKGALFPVLAFPLLLPLVFIGIDALSMSMNGTPFYHNANNLLVILSYNVVVIIVSWWLFDFVWKE